MDVGRTLLALIVPDVFSQVDKLTFKESPATIESENSVIGTNHCELGGWFVIVNGLPEALYSVVNYHHTPEFAPEEHQTLVGLICAADHMANHLQTLWFCKGYQPKKNAGVAFLEEVCQKRLVETILR